MAKVKNKQIRKKNTDEQRHTAPLWCHVLPKVQWCCGLFTIDLTEIAIIVTIITIITITQSGQIFH